MRKTASFLLLVSAIALHGCGDTSAERPNTEASAPSAAEGARRAPALPDGFFLAAEPAGAISVSEARASAKTGDDIVLTGHVGGRSEPFVENRAVFLLADAAKAPACADECGTPWDACCVPGETIAANSATVQVVDSDGNALHVSLSGRNGLAPGSEVTVQGRVREAGDAILIVDATGMTVR